jgi:trk system potassium uptake protein
MTSLRHSAFNVVSMATTTGFVTQDYSTWPVFAPIWMLFLSCIVCSTGSTVLTFALLMSGLDFDSSFSAIVAAINNTAHGLGTVGPVRNYHSLTVFQTWVCTVAMLLGRLEIFSVIVLFTPAFWRK